MQSEENNKLDWDQNFTEEVIQSMDAIEASLQPSSSSSSSSIVKKRRFTEESTPKTRRRLPDSIVSPRPSPPFSLSCCRADSKLRYPPLRFGGEILYSRTTDEVEKAAGQLLKILEMKKKEMGQVAVGFDIEWKPTFRRGVLPSKAAVMQICLDTNYCYVMHIFHSGIPPSLRFLLEDSTVIKVGVAIGGDAVKVFSDYNVSVKAVEDLSDLANQKLNRDRRHWGLASLTETLVCKESFWINNYVQESRVLVPICLTYGSYLSHSSFDVRLNISLGKYIKVSVLQLPKPNKIRLGNWELYPLSKEQLRYAATDAFASWHLHQVLKHLPDVVKDTADTRNEIVPADTRTESVPADTRNESVPA
ncbi:hypothetical protein COLO4_20229 [Corchorus olitorius]|uniref:3'-5' exonuclease n=1 Tax=Corchorus olitorius TaxID=93759 RepID=A0A1R3J142_9ROSI|nr:hypothetical protein COLO4_20229 [Corchorus olitorius]